jgi:hypothetical protein
VAKATVAKATVASMVAASRLSDVRSFDVVKHHIRDLTMDAAGAKMFVEVSKGGAVRDEPKGESQFVLADILTNTAANDVVIDHSQVVGLPARVLKWLIGDLSEDVTDFDRAVLKVEWHSEDRGAHAVLVAVRVLHQEVLAVHSDRACHLGGRTDIEAHRLPTGGLDLSSVAA